MKSSLLLIALAFTCLMFSAKTQCDNCTSGTFCYTQDNTFSGAMDTSPTTYCATCMSGCANCSDFSSCNQCDVGYFYLTQDNTFSGALDTSPTYSCSSCISNCNSCSSINSCDQCSPGYTYDGSSCTSSDLELISTDMSKFNIIWIVVIVVGVTAIIGFIAITFYCLSKKKKNILKAYEINYVKE